MDQEFGTAEKRVIRIWNRMTFEVNTLSQRLSQMVTSQAFLFTAFFFALARLNTELLYSWVLAFCIPIVGLTICTIAGIYVRTANVILGDLRTQLIHEKNKFPEQLLDSVDTNKQAADGRKAAQFANSFLILLFTAFWLIAIGVLIRNW